MDAKELPARPNLEQYKKQAKDLVKARKSGDAEVLRRIRRFHPRLRKLPKSDFLTAALSPLSLSDSQLVIAREHGFESWPKFSKHIEELARANSPISQFERAADAVIAGDLTTLKRLLREDPELIRARSTREHQSTLLHYVSANGVEDFRQKTPKNVVDVLNFLLSAGAEVDAVNNPGQGTTLGLVATSIHPLRAGVQIALLETLLDAGASLDGAPGGWNPLKSALHNGRGQAAKFLAQRGARLDLEAAAGAGELNVVKSFFSNDGNFKPTATKAQMESGFMWACEFGRNSVVEFLLSKGVDLSTQANTGETGLHWAVIGGQLETIKLLLKHGASLETKNAYDGTALSQALWSAINGDPGIDYARTVEMLLRAGAKIEDGSLTWLAQQKDGPSSMKTRIAELLRLHGATS